MGRLILWVVALVAVMAVTEAAGGGKFVRYGSEQGLPDETVRALVLDGSGNLWAGTLSGGVAVFRGERFEPIGSRAMASEFVRDLAWSSKGELWAATDQGAARIVGNAVEWMGRETPGLGSADLIRIVPDRADRTWLLPLDYDAQGISVWDGTRLHELRWPEGRPVNRLLSVALGPAGSDFAGQVLLLSESALLRVREERLEAVPLEGTPLFRPSPPGRDEEEEAARFPPVFLQAAHQASDGTIWFVHPRAILALDGSGFHEKLSLPEANLGPWAVQTPDEALWFCSFEGLLIRVGQDGAVQRMSLSLAPRERIDLLYPGRDSSLWIATSGPQTGLLRVRQPLSEAERITGEAGAASFLSVNEMLEDETGHLWIATDQGLYRLAL